MATIENYQNNLRFELCTDENHPSGYLIKEGKVQFTIEDKTQPLITAHIFHTGYVTLSDAPAMCNEMFEGYCEWLVENKQVIIDHFKNK